jgi:AcrR family transcriptional regulator
MDKKELIIEAALKLFVENGFHGTATGKIAQEAGVATGTLFNYFKTKDELVIAIYIQLKEELANYITENTENQSDTKGKIKIQISATLFWGLDNSSKFRFIQQFHSSPYLSQVEVEVINKQVLPHLQLIQTGINEDLIKVLPVDLIYSIISSQTFGLYQYLTSKELSKVEQHDTIQNTFEMLWEMIKK